MGNAPNVDFILALAGPGDVIGSLHTHQRVHIHSKGFLNAERHVSGTLSLAVKQAGQRGPGNTKRDSRRRYRQACRVDDFCPDEISGMGRVVQGISRRVTLRLADGEP